VPKGCCGAADFLFLYKGTVAAPPAVGGAGINGGDNVMNLDYSASCSANDLFYVCEKTGIIITSTVKATFTEQQSGTSCSSGTQLSCQ
jgi:hypothetical protein